MTLLNRIFRKISILKNGFVCDAPLKKGVKISKRCIIDKYTIIGKYTFVNTNCMFTKASIGNYCSIGSNVIIGPGEHELNRISISGYFYEDSYEELTKKTVNIGHDVWIGTNAIIMRGVQVGTGAVIGAGAIVTKDVPDYAVVVGIPAKIIKYRFEPSIQKKIIGSGWFLEDLTKAKEIISMIENDI